MFIVLINLVSKRGSFEVNLWKWSQFVLADGDKITKIQKKTLEVGPTLLDGHGSIPKVVVVGGNSLFPSNLPASGSFRNTIFVHQTQNFHQLLVLIKLKYIKDVPPNVFQKNKAKKGGAKPISNSCYFWIKNSLQNT